MLSSSTRVGLAVSIAAAGAWLLWQPPASASQPRPPVEADDPIQILADAVLVESECGQINLDYGRLFAFAERRGVRPVDIMPLGDRRASFDAAYRRRARDTKGDDLCGTLAGAIEATIPGVLTAR